MRAIKIQFPLIDTYEKTRLIPDPENDEKLNTEPGETAIFVRNVQGFSANDYIILDAFESQDAEIVRIQAVDRETHVIDLATEIYQNHAVGGPGQTGAVVMKTPYNKVKIFRGLLSTMVDHTLLALIDLRPDMTYTYFNDYTGLSTNYYSYQMYNSYGESVVTGTDGNKYRCILNHTASSSNQPITGANYATYWILTNADAIATTWTNAAAYVTGTSLVTSGTQTLYSESDYDSVLTVSTLKQNFMFGLDLTDDDGNPFPQAMFEFAIRAAIDSLEKVLQIKIKPTTISGEYQDYYRQDYMDFAFIQLNNYPIVSVTKVAMKYPTAQTEIIFPTEWYQINTAHGQVHLIPTSGSLSQILMGKGGDYLTFVWKGWDWMPNLWRIDYTAGFASGTVPYDVLGVIGKMACFYPLNIAGDLVGGIAIASKSIGIDGLSQSINTTSSPENAGYSARLRQYERELKTEIPRLQAFYKGIKMAVC